MLAAWLATPEGLALLDRAAALPGDVLAVGAALRRAGVPASRAAAATTQVELRTRAAGRFTRADRMLFTRAGLEQSSDETAARRRAARLAAGGTVADLCCGIGGDLLALAGVAERVLAVDQDPVHLTYALHNARVYDARAALRGRVADVRALAAEDLGDAVLVDPARRTATGRLPPGVSEPPLGWCLQLAERVDRVAVKVAPGLDRARVPPGWEAEFVAAGRDLVEAVLWSPALAAAPRRATVLPSGDSLVPAPGLVAPLGDPDAWLVDPSPAVTRAAAVADLAAAVGGWLIDPDLAFVAAARRPRTVFGRVLRVERSLPWQQRSLARLLSGLGLGTVDLRRRGLAGDADVVRRQLGLHRLHGDRQAVLVMTRWRGRPWALLCVAPDDPPLGGQRG